MVVTKKHLSRRTVLKASGLAVGLPFLDAMVPAMTAQVKTAANPGLRFAGVYLPQGMIVADWVPRSTEPGFDFPSIIKSLEPHREQLVVVSGLETPNLSTHATAISMFLNGRPPKHTEGEDISADVALDQLIAQKIGQETPFPSLELGIEDMSGSIGACRCRLQLHLLQFPLLAHQYDAAANGDEPSRALRADVVWRRRQP